MIEIRTIHTPKEIEQFIDFRTELYKNDPCAVPYLVMDEKRSLSKEKNSVFEFCEAEYYMAYRDGKPVGRVAAMINHKSNERWGNKHVRFGYFDFIDDYEVSAALIEKVKEYGRAKGMKTIIGPMGFTDMAREGMLVEGFDVMATMHANHNFPYYPKHIDHIGGFAKDNDWVQELITVPDAVPEKMQKIAEMIGKRYNLHARKVTKKELVKGNYGRKLFYILNECYKNLYEFSALSDHEIDMMVNDYIGIADMNLVTLVFDESIKTEEEPEGKFIGFGVSFPSFSEALRKTKDGRLLPFGWLHLLRTLKTHNTPTVDLMLIGVLPEYRSKGANAIIFDDLIRWYLKYGFKQALTLPMMETNEGVLSAWQYFDSHIAKRLRSYKASL